MTEGLFILALVVGIIVVFRLITRRVHHDHDIDF